jgi:DNA-binding MarR family transcriptional regulator
VPEPGSQPDLADSEYRRLLSFRTGIRRFLNWSETQATGIGVTPGQHQLMLAIRGHDGPDGPTIRDVADSLILRHNSTVGLVDRAVDAGLVARHVDEHDARVVRLRLTALGSRRIRQLSGAHLEELRRLVPRVTRLWADLES